MIGRAAAAAALGDSWRPFHSFADAAVHSASLSLYTTDSYWTNPPGRQGNQPTLRELLLQMAF